MMIGRQYSLSVTKNSLIENTSDSRRIDPFTERKGSWVNRAKFDSSNACSNDILHSSYTVYIIKCTTFTRHGSNTTDLHKLNTVKTATVKTRKIKNAVEKTEYLDSIKNSHKFVYIWLPFLNEISLRCLKKWVSIFCDGLARP